MNSSREFLRGIPTSIASASGSASSLLADDVLPRLFGLDPMGDPLTGVQYAILPVEGYAGMSSSAMCAKHSRRTNFWAALSNHGFQILKAQPRSISSKLEAREPMCHSCLGPATLDWMVTIG